MRHLIDWDHELQCIQFKMAISKIVQVLKDIYTAIDFAVREFIESIKTAGLLDATTNTPEYDPHNARAMWKKPKQGRYPGNYYDPRKK